MLKPKLGFFRQQQQPCADEQKIRCCSHVRCFEPLIDERRLTLGLNHEGTFAKTSKPLQPQDI